MERFSQNVSPLNLINMESTDTGGTGSDIQEGIIDDLQDDSITLDNPDAGSDEKMLIQSEDATGVHGVDLFEPAASTSVDEVNYTKVIGGESDHHDCVNFEEKLCQCLGSGGQVYQTTGYECISCNQMYTASQLQTLASERQQKALRHVTTEQDNDIMSADLSENVDMELELQSEQMLQKAENTVSTLTSMEDFSNAVSQMTSITDGTDKIIPTSQGNESNPMVEHHPPPSLSIDSTLEEIVSMESDETKYLIGQPRIARLMKYPGMFSQPESKYIELEKQLRSSTVQQPSNTPFISQENVPTSSAASTILDQAQQELSSDVVTFQITDINQYIQQIQNNVSGNSTIDTGQQELDENNVELVLSSNKDENNKSNQQVESEQIISMHSDSNNISTHDNFIAKDVGTDINTPEVGRTENNDGSMGESIQFIQQPGPSTMIETINTTGSNIFLTSVSNQMPSIEENVAINTNRTETEDKTLNAKEPSSQYNLGSNITVTFSRTDKQQTALDNQDVDQSRGHSHSSSTVTTVTSNHSAALKNNTNSDISSQKPTQSLSINSAEAKKADVQRQRALDKLISKLEHVSKTQNSGMTQVLLIEPTSQDSENSDDDNNSENASNYNTDFRHEHSTQNQLSVQTDEAAKAVCDSTNFANERRDECNDDDTDDAVENDNYQIEIHEEQDGVITVMQENLQIKNFETGASTNFLDLYEEQVRLAEEKKSNDVQSPFNVTSKHSVSEIHQRENKQKFKILHMKTKGDGTVLTLYQCTKCQVAFPSQDGLEKHYVSTHSTQEFIQVNTSNQTASSENINTKRNKGGTGFMQVDGKNIYLCRCKSRFETISELEEHLATVDHSHVDASNSHQCRECDRGFHSYQGLIAHMAVHTSQYRDKMNNKRPTIVFPVEPVESESSNMVARKLFIGEGNQTVKTTVQADNKEHQVKIKVEEPMSKMESNLSMLPNEINNIETTVEECDIRDDAHGTGELTINLDSVAVGTENVNVQVNPSSSSADNRPQEISDAVILEDNAMGVTTFITKNNTSSNLQTKPTPITKPTVASSLSTAIEKDILSITCIRCNKSYSCVQKWSGALQCSACRWNFESPPHLQCHYDHFHMHDRKCPLCGYVSNRCSSSIMDKHFKTAHPGKEIFHCYLCESTFTTRACLRNHVTRHFQPLGNFECPHCHMKFDKEQRLNIHKVRNHSQLLGYPKGEAVTAEQPTLYMCGICGRQYEYEGTLRMHLRKHQTVIDQE